MRTNDRLIAIGEVVRAHGLHGELKIAPLTDHPERFERLSECVLWDASRDERETRRITTARSHGDSVLITVAGCDSPEAARSLVGRLIALPATEAMPPGEGRFYPWQLEGARVVTDGGRDVGRVVRIESSPGQELWVVQGDTGREHLIPAVPEIVLDVDLGAQRVVIRPPDGLLEL